MSILKLSQAWSVTNYRAFPKISYYRHSRQITSQAALQGTLYTGDIQSVCDHFTGLPTVSL